jgi:hypothetical protein
VAIPFLKSLADHIYQDYKDNTENLCIVLPNKRGALFLKKHLATVYQKTIWLPAMISAEDLVAELSGLKTLEELDLLCHLYESYKACYGEKAETFDSFARWGHLILQDFNEIDRYLADSSKLYENLKEIKVIENWSLGQEQLSEFQINYLEFMGSLGNIYRHFTSFLLKNGWAYQGLAYREAVKNLESTTYGNQYHKIIFAGFNALNTAEMKIFNHFFRSGKANLVWDADNYYLNNSQHEAGFFLRKNFGFFHQKEPKFIENNFTYEKKIEVVSVPRQIGQAQVVKQCLEKFIERKIPLDKVAVVLANEKLLWPVLKQIPAQVEFVNITMEYPLRYTSTYALMDALIQIQMAYSKQARKQKYLYYRDLTALLNQPLFNTWLRASGATIETRDIVRRLGERNISFITSKYHETLFENDVQYFIPVISEYESMNAFCTMLINFLEKLQEYFIDAPAANDIQLELEYLHIFIRNLNRLKDILTQYPHFSEIRSFKQLFSQVLGSSSAPFIGEPLRGLQVMGVLETRTLDFEYLILLNVNESVLPSGKSVNSFIPNDLKRAFDLPLYAEKDAIYSYHFYRLLQRAKEVVITYDSETDTFGKGEKSRFITQLQLEMPHYSKTVSISEFTAVQEEMPDTIGNEIKIAKTEKNLDNILNKVSNEERSGFSPSSLMAYKDCSLKFYFRYEAGLKEIKVVEESAEAGTFGTILHSALETLYSEFTGKQIPAATLKNKLNAVDEAVKAGFREYFNSDELSGKSLLQFEVIKTYVDKLIKSDLQLLENLKGKTLELKALETEFKTPLRLNINNTPATVFISGTTDRLDMHSGNLRIIDYKSSVRDTDRFEFSGFDTLFEDKRYDKQLQLMIYCWLLYKNNFCDPTIMQPMIIPFREFSNTPRMLTGKDKKPLQFSSEFLDEFEQHLKHFIEKIFDQSSVFTQTEDKDSCIYCDFRLICNR